MVRLQKVLTWEMFRNILQKERVNDKKNDFTAGGWKFLKSHRWESIRYNHPNDEMFSHVESIYWTRQDAISDMKSGIFNYWSDVVGGKIVCT